MALTCGLKCIKFTLFFFNFLFVLAGVGLIIVGAIAVNMMRQSAGWLSTPVSVASFVIAIGCIMFIIAFFGCCGAVRESYCLIVAFAVSLSIVFALELAAGVVAFLHRDQITAGLPNALNQTMPNYIKDGGVANGWDFLQSQFGCCGVNHPSDWHGDLGANRYNDVPDSCCLSNRKNGTVGCGTGVLALPSKSQGQVINTVGCYAQLKHVMAHSITIISVVAVILCIVQLMGIVFASCLAHEIHSQYERV